LLELIVPITKRRGLPRYKKMQNDYAVKHGGAAPTLVAFHVGSDAKGLSAAHMRALERLLARVAVAVDAKARRPRKRLVAGRADVAVLRLQRRSDNDVEEQAAFLSSVRDEAERSEYDVMRDLREMVHSSKLLRKGLFRPSLGRKKLMLIYL
jgi:hypothetical protein